MRMSKPPAERREELLAAARRLFDVRGVAATRVADIVGSVGVAQGVFYYYFPSKEALVEEILAKVEAEITEAADAIVNNEEDFGRKLARFIELYLDVVDQFLGDEETSLRQLGQSKLWQHMPARHTAGLLQQRLVQLVQQGAQSGAVGAAYPKEAARVLLYGLHQLAEQKLPTRQMIYALTEQSLAMAPGALTQYLLPPATDTTREEPRDDSTQ